MKKNYNQIYGKWSLGTGYWLKGKLFKVSKEDILNDEIIDSYKSQILQDLYRIGLVKKIKNFSIMDVGTGRQALAFEKIGVKKIDLFDISKSNYDRFKKFKLDNPTIINNYRFDIGSKKFSKIKKRFDLIYLHGVVQHTKNPLMTIKNLSKKLKNKGFLWLYFYNFGSVKNIYLSLMREIVLKKKIPILKIVKNLKPKLSKNKFDGIMDDLTCDYAHLLPAKYYMNIMNNFGFDLKYSKDFYPKEEISLRVSNVSCLSLFQNNRIKRKIKKIKPIQYYDILDKKFYCNEDKEIIGKLFILRKKIRNNIKQINDSGLLLKICLIYLKYSDKHYQFKPHDLICNDLLKCLNKIEKISLKH